MLYFRPHLPKLTREKRNGYDAMNRLLVKATAAGLVLMSYAYSASGMRTQMVDASGTQNYVYDARDRLRTNATPVGTLHYEYDRNGNLTNLWSSTANGVWVSYQYDALNRLTNVIDQRLTGTKNTAYTFDPVGNCYRLFCERTFGEIDVAWILAG